MASIRILTHRHSSSRRVPLLLLWLALVVPACTNPEASEYRATIRRTAYSIPHIRAENWSGLGFGEGYAAAEDHFCSIADQVVRVRSQRARFFGAGPRDAHLLSDLGLKALDIQGRAERDLGTFPSDIQALYRGYAAGYNQYLSETGVDNLPGWCRGASWVSEIAAVDLVAYARSLFMISAQFAAAIAAAQPPGGPTSTAQVDLPQMAGASNAWAIGSERSESGGGMLLANPHYPWVGSNRFWEKHLTIPGEIDVYGVSLIGSPGVSIGFTERVAWTHTVSSGVRYTLYRVKLAERRPTSYVYDGQRREMTAHDVSVEVLRDDGSVEVVQRTLFATHHGPVLAFANFGWTDEHAFAIRDGNADNDEAIPQWSAMAQASSMEEFQRVLGQYSAMPWVNTIAASADGRAWYVDASSTPHLSPAALEAWKTLSAKDPVTARAFDRGIIVLDGSDARYEWVDDPNARDPGVLPFDALPQLERRDYVFNANDSYWLTNSSQLLTGYNALHALQEATPRSPRTRMNDMVLSDRSTTGPSGADGRFSLEEMATAAFVNRSLTAELLAPAVAQRCRTRSEVTVDGRTVRLAKACAALDGFDARLELHSRGAVLWREFITHFNPDDLRDAGRLFAQPFEAAHPVRTPRGLATPGDDAVLQSLARAVLVLERAGFALDIPLGELQHSNKNGGRIPVHGGQGYWEGVTNYANYASNATTLEPEPPVKPLVRGSRFLRADGYPVNRGTSFIMALDFTDDGPRAVALLTYSQSGDPESPHFTDQTWLFSKKEWRPIRFRDIDIAADPDLRVYEVSAPDPF